MSTTDSSNYGTPLSYAVLDQDNEITFTDYSGFVFAIKGTAKVIHIQRIFLTFKNFSYLGNKVVTDVTANNGMWYFLCASWSSKEGYWAIFKVSQLVF